MKMKPIILLAMLCLVLNPRSFSQSFVTITGSSNLFISSGSTIDLNNLALIPSTGYNLLANTTTLNSAVSHPYSTGIPILRSYLFSNTLPAFSGAISISYKTPELNGLNASTLELNGYTSGWHHYTSTTGTNVATASGLNSVAFSELTLASLLAPLPLKWISVNAYSDNGLNSVKWTTADEVNCKDYQVFKSPDAITWQTAGFPINALNGSGLNNYSWIDSSGAKGLIFYRVRQRDFDDAYSYSITVSLKDAPAVKITVYPNPSANQLSVSSGDATLNLKQLRVYDESGKLVAQTGPINASQYSLSTGGFAKGTYVLFIQLSNGTTTTRTFLKK